MDGYQRNGGSVKRAERTIRIQVAVGLGADQVAAVDRLAGDWRTSRANVIRRMVDFFLAENTHETDTLFRDSEPEATDAVA